ncbi:MAG: hypothetical protein HQL49_00865 [Gammaproteobacteria bacterium]|nr:hypothetical protein [Gammaproteobacteria bacterium]
MQSNQKRQSKRSRYSLWLSLLVAPVVMLAWGIYASYVMMNGVPGGEDGSWSANVLAEIHEGIVTASPIGIANACGLGASSCFKCHNGTRAALAAPKPWHTEHEKVNHSCVGCHDGNERLMLKEMAHKELVGNPILTPEKYCMNCHKDADMQTLVGKYQSAM